MNKKLLINIITIIAIMLIIIAILPSFAMADINPNDYKPGAISKTDSGKIVNLANPIIGVIKVVGIVVLVVVLLIMGIKYMVGSVSEKADYKKSMLPYLIGTIFIVGITEVIAFIIDAVAELG